MQSSYPLLVGGACVTVSAITPDDEPGLRSPLPGGMRAGATTGADVASHYRGWLSQLPDDAPDMTGLGRDGNLYYDDDENFWRVLLTPDDSPS